MASKPQKTLADYLVIAISPALIMLIVGSLVFFLQELGYRGEHTDRMRWILFWVVFAFVLTARIGIEQGREHSITYGLALGVVTVLAMIRYADNVVLSIILLLVAWWCADRLTWDCTLVDDEEDASGTGLLDGEDSNAPEATSDSKRPERADSAGSSHTTGSRARDLVDALSSNEPEAKKQRRAPGRTVLYFSLAALPLFGIGQVFIPATDVAARTYAFRLLWVYLASALALLLSTSFLGLRRYLRQRRLEMPANIVRTWIGTGTVLILLILACCIFLPRPDATYSVASLGEVVESTVRNASKIAFLRGDAGKDEGERIGEAKDKGAPKDDGEAKENADANDEGQANNQGDAKIDGQAQDNAAAQQKGDQQSPEAADGDKGAGKSGEGRAKKNSEQEGQKSEGKGKDSESKSEGESAENDKSQAGKSSSQKSQDNKGEAAEEDREKDESDRDQAEGNGKRNDAAAKGLKNRNQQKQGQNQQAQQRGQKQDGAKQADAKQKNAPNNAATPPDRKQSPSNNDLSDWLSSLAKWLFYGLFAVFIAWILFRYWAQILDALAQLWASLLALFGGRKTKPAAPKQEVAPAEPVRRPLPFAAFRSPFAAGTAERMRIEELIQYTFDALQAWANDRNLGRDPEQTPLEFSKALGARVPNFSREIDETALLYARVAYSSHTIPRSCLPVLEKLWRRMSSE